MEFKARVATKILIMDPFVYFYWLVNFINFLFQISMTESVDDSKVKKILLAVYVRCYSGHVAQYGRGPWLRKENVN